MKHGLFLFHFLTGYEDEMKNTHWSPLDGDCEIFFFFFFCFFFLLNCGPVILSFLPLWEEAIAFWRDIFKNICKITYFVQFYLLIEVLKDLRQVQRMPYSLSRHRQLFCIKDSIRHKQDNKSQSCLECADIFCKKTKTQTPKTLGTWGIYFLTYSQKSIRPYISVPKHWLIFNSQLLFHKCHKPPCYSWTTV